MERPFKSFLATDIQQFIARKKAENCWCNSYNENMHYFDKYIHTHYPESTGLTQDMMEWCKPRLTENGNSCRARTTAIWNFVSYLRERGKTDVAVLRCTANLPVELVPHFFTHEELHLFFCKCDIMWDDCHKTYPTIHNLLNKLELPVFFRLLFSSGMRTNEVRELRREDIDLQTGVVNIEKSKGLDKHRVVLHATMLELLQKYDEAMEKVMPHRIYLFPAKGDKPHRAAWEGYHFRNVWPLVSSQAARPYDFRHHYATTNISQWENHGFEFSGRLLNLSRSMGHKSIQSTFGYFHLTPMLKDKLKRNCGESFEKLVPLQIDDCINLY